MRPVGLPNGAGFDGVLTEVLCIEMSTQRFFPEIAHLSDISPGAPVNRHQAHTFFEKFEGPFAVQRMKEEVTTLTDVQDDRIHAVQNFLIFRPPSRHNRLDTRRLPKASCEQLAIGQIAVCTVRMIGSLSYENNLLGRSFFSHADRCDRPQANNCSYKGYNEE